MEFRRCKIVASALILVTTFCIDFGASSTSIDEITTTQFIKNPEFLLSPSKIFKLGFFNPENSTNRYVGIWYNQISVFTPIWVANRNQPIKDSNGIMKVIQGGNLVILNGQNTSLWSSNVPNGVHNSSAKLNDDGNLVLLDNNGNTVWESFQEPTDTFVMNMKSTIERSKKQLTLRSWKGPSDPAIGSFSAGVDPSKIPEVFIWNGSVPYWRSGPYNGKIFIGTSNRDVDSNGLFTISVDKKNGTYSSSFKDNYSLRIYVLDYRGKLLRKFWQNNSWMIEGQNPATECDVYGVCGEFGICSNSNNSPICSCLNGFEPKNTNEWGNGNWTSGCVRKRLLQCENIKNGDGAGKEDGFMKMEPVKVPDFANWSYVPEQECINNCLNNCSCIAYSYISDVGCMSWSGNLTDMKKFSSQGQAVYIRLAYSELENKRNMKVIISIAVGIGVTASLSFAIFFIIWQYRGRKSRLMFLIGRKENHLTLPDDGNMFVDHIDKVKLQELPEISLQKLVLATGNFDISNRLGQGGFGPVYKGVMEDGREIAVKRLSRASGQGLEEFMNEVVLISKLQHRNLVRLFGCCVEGEEKMLIYEHLPNKGLDAFLFDPNKKQVLDWRKRFHIIEGICRGLLYLHRDSRLKIIHRDLKTSNILLDQNLIPKISDFGMARIFGGNEDQAKTRRVVGTYGYMSPEYAMQGQFSEKSDVFSFGVLLLEIVSGSRNTSFSDEQDLTLLGYAWKLWKEGNTTTLVDAIVYDPNYEDEIFRCIHVGLLCVQEFAKDRPIVSTIISMLNSEIVDLPMPKQPAFTDRQSALNSGSSQQNLKNYSVNLVSLTAVDGR